MPNELPAPPDSVIAAVTHADPYPYYARLREGATLPLDEATGLRVASRFSVVLEAFGARSLRVRPPGEPVPGALLGTATGEVFGRLVRMNDGAFHAGHKPRVEQVTRGFTPAQVAEASREVLRDLLPSSNPNELLTGLSVQVIAALLGIPPAARAETGRWVQRFANGITPGATPEAIVLANESVRHLMSQGEREGLDAIASANRFALMQQPLDATAGLIGNTICLLLRRPELETHLARPDAARALASEVARWDAPVQNTRRFAAEDTFLAGEPIRLGEALLLVLASANRDESANPRGEEFDVSRLERRSLTFGAGAHGCPGEAIAIEIAATVIPVLRAEGPFERRFRPTGAYRPLPNARVPMFAEVPRESGVVPSGIS